MHQMFMSPLYAMLCTLLMMPAVGAQTLFPLSVEDDFEQGAGNWEFNDPANWDVLNLKGNHVLTIKERQNNYKPEFRSPFHIALLKDKQYGDFEIVFKVQSPEDTGNHRDCAVYWGYQDPSHFYYVHIGKKPDAVSGQIMIVNGEPRKKLSANTREIPWTDDWHTVKVRRIISTGEISVYFDDMTTPAMTAKDNTFGVGRIGIGSFDDRDHFDDVKVYGFEVMAD